MATAPVVETTTPPTERAIEWIGVDVSKERLDVYDLSQKTDYQFDNTVEGIQALGSLMQHASHPAIVCEASGGYERPMALHLNQLGLHVSIVNPKRVRDLAKGMGKLAKTDALDAQMIAKYGEVTEPTATVFAADAEVELKTFVVRRRQLVEMMTAEKNRRQRLLGPARDDITEHIDWLETKIKQLDKKIEQLSDSTLQWRQRKAILRSPKGVGPVTSASLLVLLPELGQMNRKAIAALVGLAPFSHDSGNFRGRRHIWGGRAAVRSLLYMVTLSAIRVNPPVRAYYQHLLDKGKLKKVALIACMRKILVCLNAMVKHNQFWCDDKVTAVFSPA